MEFKARRCRVILKSRVKIQSTCHLGSAAGHEIQPKRGFKGALHWFSMSESIYLKREALLSLWKCCIIYSMDLSWGFVYVWENNQWRLYWGYHSSCLRHFKQPVLLTEDVEFKCGLLSSQTAAFISCGHYWKQPSRRSLWVVIRVKDIGNLCCLVLLFVNNPMKTGLQNHSLLQLHLSKINIRSIF